MATVFSSLITEVRSTLQATAASDSFFSDTVDILPKMIDACRDLWRGIKDLKEDHFLTIDITNMSIAASAFTVTGVPADLFEIRLIEPRDLTNAAVRFFPQDWKGEDHAAARALAAQDPNNGLVVYYQLIGAGPDVDTPTIRIAPQLSSALNLTVGYIRRIDPTLTTASNVPVPMADAAIKAYALAHLLARDREGTQPDAAWLKIYDTEKQDILAAVSPRQTQENEVAQGLFEGEWQ